MGRETEGLAEFHERLVELARSGSGQSVLRPTNEPMAHRGSTGVPPFERPSGEDAEPVGVERHLGGVERQACHCRGDVGSDARELPKLLDAVGKLSAALSDENPSGLVEVAGPGVVARSFPGLQHLFLGGAGEIAHGGKSSDETFEVRRSLGDPRLLEENLRDPDAVRRPVLTPGQRPPVPAEPDEQRSDAGVGARSGAGTGGTAARIHRLATRTTRL